MIRLFRFIDRNFTLVVVVITFGLALILQTHFNATNIMKDLADDSTLIGLFGTVAGFLITGLTILLTQASYGENSGLKKTRAFRKVHYSFLSAIWMQVVALVVSLVLRISPADTTSGWVYFTVLAVSLEALALLAVSVYYLTSVVNQVIRADE